MYTKDSLYEKLQEYRRGNKKVVPLDDFYWDFMCLLMGLPSRQKVFAAEYYLQGEQVEQIAERHKWSVATCDNIHDRIINAFLRKLNE